MHFRLIRCLARAVAKRGVRLLLDLVPGGDAAFDIAVDTWEEYCKDEREEALKAEVQELARAPAAQVQQEVQAAVQDEAADLPAEDQKALTTYLGQVAPMIRRSLRRPADPTGTTIPPGMPLAGPEALLPFLPPRPPRFQSGDRPLPGVDRVLEELLGIGGFGEVWKARKAHMGSARPVALKFCLGLDAFAKKTLENEVALVDRLMKGGCPSGIVPMLEAYLDADPPCLEYQYVEGGDLGGLIQDLHARGQMTPEVANRLFLKLVEIVATTHRADPPIVHCDLKPANILVAGGSGGEFDLRVTDFGIGGLAAAQAVGLTKGALRSRQGLLTEAVRGAYTPLYASPEQMTRRRGTSVDPRDDVHALGVIWFQLLTGDMGMFTMPTDWRDHVEERGLAEGLVRLLASCLASKAEKRVGSAVILSENLKKQLLWPTIRLTSTSLGDESQVRQEQAERQRRDVEEAEQRRQAEDSRIKEEQERRRDEQRRRLAEEQRQREEERQRQEIEEAEQRRRAEERRLKEEQERLQGEEKRRREEQERQRQQAENLARWKSSAEARAWVEALRGQWGHEEWQNLLKSLAKTSYWPMDPDELGLVMEEIKRQWLAEQRNREEAEQHRRKDEEQRQREEVERQRQQRERLPETNHPHKVSATAADAVASGWRANSILQVVLGGLGLILVVITVAVLSGQWCTPRPTRPKAGFHPKAGSQAGEIVTNPLGMRFAWCPPGTFTMGSPPGEIGRQPDEIQHQVTLKKGFYMGATEVTQAQWQAVMGNNPSGFKGDDRPVEYVRWGECEQFCKSLSQSHGIPYRLPQEDEWEYACRAGRTGQRYSSGDKESALQGVAWYSANSPKGTQPVANLEPNAWKLYDMQGNVWEWCKMGADACVLRGGSWFNDAAGCRVAYRGGGSPDYRDSHCGFRVCFFVD